MDQAMANHETHTDTFIIHQCCTLELSEHLKKLRRVLLMEAFASVHDLEYQ